MGEGYIRYPNAPNFLQNPPNSGRFVFRINGRTMTGRGVGPMTFNEVPKAFDLLTHAGSYVTQTVWRFGVQPITMQTLTGTFDWLADEEEDAWRIRRAQHGAPALFFPAYPIEEQWLIRAAPAGNTLWRTPRRHIWDNGADYNSTNYPARVFVDETELTPVSSPGPSAGEVYIPPAQPLGEFFEIETNTADTPPLTTEVLYLRYFPEYRMRFINLDGPVEEANAWRIQGQFEERILAGFGGS